MSNPLNPISPLSWDLLLSLHLVDLSDGVPSPVESREQVFWVNFCPRISRRKPLKIQQETRLFPKVQHSPDQGGRPSRSETQTTSQSRFFLYVSGHRGPGPRPESGCDERRTRRREGVPLPDPKVPGSVKRRSEGGE